MTSSLGPAVEHFAVDLLKSLNSRKEKENTLFSPWNIFICTSMVALGARGKTLNELFLGLKVNKVASDYDRIHHLIKEILEAPDNPAAPSHKSELHIANKVLIQKGFDSVSKFKEQLHSYYGSTLEKFDFVHDAVTAMKSVNGFVKEKTHGKIQTILNTPPSKNVRLLFLNAVYFEGVWLKDFFPKATTEDVFFQNGNEKTIKKVPFMCNFLECPLNHLLIENEKVKVLKLPYTGGKSMYICLPERPDGLDRLIPLMQTLLDADIYDVYKSFDMVCVELPKVHFEATYEQELKESFQTLGINDCFCPSADFSGVTTSGGLSVSRIIHKAVIEVNEKSTKEGAASLISVLYDDYSKSLQDPFIGKFKANRPFLFYIFDEQAKLILFIGVVRKL